jgi:hypothetical protein
MAQKAASTRATRRPARAEAVFTWAPVPEPGAAPAPSSWFLQASVAVMLAGMSYHLWVLDRETQQLAVWFAGAAALFILYDRLAPLAPAPKAQP